MKPFQNLQKIKQNILNFKDDTVYLLQAMPREKNEKGLTGSKKKKRVITDIVRNKKELDEKLDVLKRKVSGLGDGMLRYFYITFEAQNIINAYSEFKKKIGEIDNDFVNGQKNVALKKIKKLDKEWISSIQKTPVDKTLYLVDLDDKEKIKQVKDFFNNIKKYEEKFNMTYRNDGIEKAKILLQQETVNGYHLLVKPFNVGMFMRFVKGNNIDAEIKKDELLFLGSIQN